MKTKILLTVFMIGMIMVAYAQRPTMTLTFTADNNGQYIPVNSILIENLTQGGDTTLYAPDTVLVLDYITGMNENITFDDNSFSLSQNFPNPMKGKTTVNLYLPEKEDVLMSVSDFTGRELVNKEIQLERGNHSFSFCPGRESLYFLTARADRQSRTIKMFNTPSNSSVSGYCNLEYNGRQSSTGGYKSENNLNNFVFAPGDQLQFTANTALGERTIIVAPSGNQTYTFQYGSSGMPCPGTPTVTDIDGNVYNTVLIGSMCWMKENLKTTVYNNGTPIPNVTDSIQWFNLTSGAYVWYENDSTWKDSYGALYNWYTTVDTNGLCPTGWHVSTIDEWIILTDYIGGTGEPHGNELKSCRQVNSPLGDGCNTSEHPRWNSYIDNWGTDKYGFSGLPGGYRSFHGPSYYIGYGGYWWSTTEYSPENALYRGLDREIGYVIANMLGSNKQIGFSVRCLMD